MTNNPENNNGIDDWDEEWDDEEPDDIEAKEIMDRREFLYRGGAILASLGLLVLGSRKACIEYLEKEKARKLATKLEAKVDKEGRKLYFKDDVTGNHLQRYRMKWDKKAKEVRVVLDESGKPIYSNAWNIVKKFPEEERELVHAVNCHGKRMLDWHGRPVIVAKFVAERLKKADEMLWNSEEDYKDKQHIKIVTSFRSNLYQQRLYNERVIKRKQEGKKPWITAKVGRSRHELGFAVDVKNWAEAQPYLARAGLVGGMYSTDSDMWYGDACHFSADLKGYTLGKYNELYMDDFDLTKEYDWFSTEFATVKWRLGKFKIYGAGTEAHHYARGFLDKIADLL